MYTLFETVRDAFESAVISADYYYRNGIQFENAKSYGKALAYADVLAELGHTAIMKAEFRYEEMMRITEATIDGKDILGGN